MSTMGRPKKRNQTESKTMRIETAVLDFLAKITADESAVDGLHIAVQALMTFREQPPVTMQEAHFICDTLNGYTGGREDARLIKFDLEDAFGYGQGQQFEIEDCFLGEIANWTSEQCEGLRNAAAAFWGLVLIDNETNVTQFFRIKV